MKRFILITFMQINTIICMNNEHGNVQRRTGSFLARYNQMTAEVQQRAMAIAEGRDVDANQRSIPLFAILNVPRSNQPSKYKPIHGNFKRQEENEER